MEWVKNLRSPLPLEDQSVYDRMKSKHPITGTAERYSLYDRFHQINQKRPEEKLRSLNVCPTLRTEVNSAVAEQFNRELSAVRYSLCQMKEAHFKQTVRVLIDLHNDKINQRFKSEIENMCNTQLSIGLHGMLGLFSESAERKETLQLTSSSKMNIPPVSTESSFVAQLYAVNDNDKEKLKNLFTGDRDEEQTMACISRRFPVRIKDIRSVCPPELLGESFLAMPWLTDDAVNYRVAQLAQESMHGALASYDFILWYREWRDNRHVSDKVVRRIPVSDKIFLTRVTGDVNPERGNHFILWVFDFPEKQIRVYDPLGIYKTISDFDMDILRNVFRFSGGLEGWMVHYPVQWRQQDSVNCGVLVCAAAENEIFRREVTAETLTLNQCRSLRLYHATQMIKNMNPEDFPPTSAERLKKEREELRLQQEESKLKDSSSQCMAWKIKTCLFQRATGKTRVFHDHIREYQWVQCTVCENWLHFQCAGVEGDWMDKDFFCGCNTTPELKEILECVEADEILTDGEINDLIKKLQSGQLLSNRMYLWTNRVFDPEIRQYYCKHFSILDDTKTEQLIQRLEKLLPMPETVAEKELFITDVILPEVLVQWLQMHNMCRYRAESVLLRCTSFQGKKSAAQITSGDTESNEEENTFMRDIMAAVTWCNNTEFTAPLHVPSVLSMEKEEQNKALEKLHSWKGEFDESSPAELFTFVFNKRKDYEKFCYELIDEKRYRLFARFEEQ
nr:uncharacterized protein LOC129423979 [Misgurnus anguillicaudatus]